MSEKGLKLLASKSLVPTDCTTFLDPCDHFVFGKHHRVSFRKKSKRKETKLALVHSDTCVPIEVASMGGNKYFVTFIDDAFYKT